MLSAFVQKRFAAFLEKRLVNRSSVRLNQRNIYILPSKEGGYFSILMLIMLLTAINYQNSLVYLLTFLLGGLFVVSMWICFLNLSGLEIKVMDNADVFTGEVGHFRLRLKSNNHPHIAVLVGFNSRELQEVNIEGGGVADIAIEQICSKRGLQTMDKLRIETRFPFGLLVAWTWQRLDGNIIVYPDPLPGEKTGVSESESDTGLHHFKSDDVSSIRAYVPGDSLNRISWKHYAAHEELYSKEQQSGGGSSSWLSLDDYPNGSLEQKLSFLCHEIVELDKDTHAFGLILGAQRIEIGTGHVHTQECLRALALYGR